MSSTFPRADVLESAGVYEAKGPKEAHLPRHMLRQIARVAGREKRQGLYYRWYQVPVAGNSVLDVQCRDEEFFKPHRDFAQKQLTMDGKKKSASISTIELPSSRFDDVRPPDSMWSRIGVYHWPQKFFAWVEGQHLYVRKFFNGDELRKLNADAWEFFENHPKARVFQPTDIVRITLFYQGEASDSILRKFAELRSEFALSAVFRMVDTDHDAFDGTRYCVDALPCLYAELEGTSQLTRLTGRLSLKHMRLITQKYL